MTPNESHTNGEGSSNYPPVGEPLHTPSSITPVPIRDLLRIKNVLDTQLTSWAFALFSIGIDAVRLLWLYTPVKSGGIGLTVSCRVITLLFSVADRRYSLVVS